MSRNFTIFRPFSVEDCNPRRVPILKRTFNPSEMDISRVQWANFPFLQKAENFRANTR